MARRGGVQGLVRVGACEPVKDDNSNWSTALETSVPPVSVNGVCCASGMGRRCADLPPNNARF